MSWTDTYWDAVNEFYWVPSYLGLKSIPRKKWTVTADSVSIPRALTNPSGPLYRRTINSTDYPIFVRRQEETFNHIFNLALSLLPGRLISDVFGSFFEDWREANLGLASPEYYRSYPWISGANITSPDCFLIASNSILAIEIKFNAKTSLDQQAKYVALITSEVVYGNSQGNLALMYIYPKDAEERFLKQTSISPNNVNENCLPVLIDRCTNETVRNFLKQERQTAEYVLSVLDVCCIAWESMRKRLRQVSAGLTDSYGDQALANVLGGLQLEI